MKTKLAAALIAVAAILTNACEQHKWSETKQLFKAHEEQGADHAKAAEAHGEKKAEAPKHE